MMFKGIRHGPYILGAKQMRSKIKTHAGQNVLKIVICYTKEIIRLILAFDLCGCVGAATALGTEARGAETRGAEARGAAAPVRNVLEASCRFATS